MKTNPSRLIVWVCLAVLLMSFNDPYTIKRITDTNFKYEFYTTQKKVSVKSGRDYYWFKGGAIHHSTAGFSGEALHESYQKFFLNNQLAEQGQFNKGLKTGIWKSWFPNGKLQTVATWWDGSLKGNYLRYDDQGNLLESGNFRGNLKHGKWIDFTKKDTVDYKNGAVRVKLTTEEKAIAKAEKKKKAEEQKAAKSADPQAKKKNFFQRLFQKKDPAKAENPQPQEKKEGFFKRLFAKKKSK